MKIDFSEFEPLNLDPEFVLKSLNESAVKHLVGESQSAAWNEHEQDLKSMQRQADYANLFFGQDQSPSDNGQHQEKSEQVITMTKEALVEEYVYADSLKGHNPVFFPPYFDGGRNAGGGGLFGVALNEKFPAFGRVGISVAAYNPGGHIEHTSFVSAMTVAPFSRTVTFRASAGVSGALTSFGVFGYARATAQIVARLSIFDMATQSFRSVEARNMIGQISFGRIDFRGQQFSARGSVAVRAGEILIISGGLRVSAGCGGLVCGAVSNIRLQFNNMAVD